LLGFSTQQCPENAAPTMFKGIIPNSPPLICTLHRMCCPKILCHTAKRRDAITYGALATALGLKSPQQEWNTVLGPIAADEVRKTGHDLTLVVVYASGPAKGLERYFSNIRGGRSPQSTTMDPSNSRQVAAYKQAREQVFNRYATVQC
jgi:hypothetical protein